MNSRCPGGGQVAVEVGREKRVGLPEENVKDEAEEGERNLHRPRDTDERDGSPDEQEHRAGEHEPSEANRDASVGHIDSPL